MKKHKWIGWEGGNCPVPRVTSVVVMFGNGDIQYGDIAGDHFWSHCGDSDEEITTIDILAYRVAE